MILPGSTIGVLGGGQLGRMFAMAARRLGYRVHTLAPEDGTLSMARSGPDTGRSEFFICIGDQPELDFGGKRNVDGQGFAAFGRVIRGMDIVRKIQGLPANGQTLQPTVRIVRIRPAR